MKKYEVVPDVIPISPSDVATINYTSGVIVNEGDVLTPTQVKYTPKVDWNADSDSYYLLCMVDPDAPSRKDPKFRAWQHWLVGNIPGNDISAGDTLSAYIGAGPPKESGLHRYVFLVYKQNGQIKFDEPRLTSRSGTGRGKFSIKEFVIKYNLGDPVAGNFFQAEWDDYVPELYKKLGL